MPKEEVLSTQATPLTHPTNAGPSLKTCGCDPLHPEGWGSEALPLHLKLWDEAEKEFVVWRGGR